MKYKIESRDKEINIEVSETEDNQKKLLEAFRACQEGRCSCPTEEYSKLDSIEIENSESQIHIKLKSKPGEQIDEAEIAKCLDHTKQTIDDK